MSSKKDKLKQIITRTATKPLPKSKTCEACKDEPLERATNKGESTENLTNLVDDFNFNSPIKPATSSFVVDKDFGPRLIPNHSDAEHYTLPIDVNTPNIKMSMDFDEI